MTFRPRRILALAMLLAALWLPSHFFQTRIGFYRCSGEVCDIGVQDGALWATGKPLFIPTGHRTPQGFRIYRQGIEGLFTRADVPIPLAWFAGLLLPILLFGGAIYLAVTGIMRGD